MKWVGQTQGLRPGLQSVAPPGLTTFALLLCVFVLTSAIGCGKAAPTVRPMVVAPTSAFKTTLPPGQPKTDPDPAKASPDFTLSAQAFSEDCVRSTPDDRKKKYAGKIIDLTGTVKRVANNPNGQTLVYLEVSNDPINGVMCIMKEGGSASVGQAVKIRGLWPSDARTAGLVDCVVAGR